MAPPWGVWGHTQSQKHNLKRRGKFTLEVWSVFTCKVFFISVKSRFHLFTDQVTPAFCRQKQKNTSSNISFVVKIE